MPNPPARPPRSGLTVVEVLVALILVAVAMLAMAGSTSLALRTTLDAQRRRDAAHLIESRLSRLAAAGCPAAMSGEDADPSRHLRERWTIAGQAGPFATVTDSISWLSARGPVGLAVTSAIPC